MKFVAIGGSHHQGSQSLKVSQYLGNRGQKLGVKFEVIDLATAQLPFWTGADSQCEAWKKIQPLIQEADAFCIVSPEWGGMVTPQLKNFLLYTAASDVGHKPVVAVSVSSGVGGAYPISELRMSGYKNSKLCYIPEHLVIRNVEQVLNSSPTDEDLLIRERIDHTLQVLIAYASAMKSMRQNAKVDLFQFMHGM